MDVRLVEGELKEFVFVSVYTCENLHDVMEDEDEGRSRGKVQIFIDTTKLCAHKISAAKSECKPYRHQRDLKSETNKRFQKVVNE